MDLEPGLGGACLELMEIATFQKQNKLDLVITWWYRGQKVQMSGSQPISAASKLGSSISLRGFHSSKTQGFLSLTTWLNLMI